MVEPGHHACLVPGTLLSGTHFHNDPSGKVLWLQSWQCTLVLCLVDGAHSKLVPIVVILAAFSGGLSVFWQ